MTQTRHEPTGQAAMKMHQLITADGTRVHDELLDPFVQDVDRDALISLYRDMVVVRRIDVEATALQRQGQLALWPPMLGQEASQVGSVHAMDQDDFIFPTYRENGVAYLRGAKFPGIMGTWRGNMNTGWDPYQLNMATPQIIIGSQTLHATGYAMGIAMEGRETLAIAYLGDGATSQGDVHESMVFAASFQAPVIFFCQNNHWAISEPVGLQSAVPIAGRAQGYGIPGLQVDGNDVLAVLAAVRWAARRARTGGGPSFIEAVTYRMGPHTTADDPTRYRGVTELEEWAAKDPLSRLRTHLANAGMLDDAAQAGIEAEADAVAAELRDACINMPDPEPMTVFDDIYAEDHSVLDREREQYRRYLASFEGQLGAGQQVQGSAS
ncbi:pyruvate dehydrogenase E1 component alpha subunit [Arthrobacter stackebrandtii]|uniref:Pyruvate dehydrogenase E1 component alpha subunit n=1 Tax=Arthrobacter stackebrandtii TaxID=272161 RepID=A0ABS4YRB4_9MICC|nr:pyruvate dehydrogenase (acetyl-transferring) E1 component subunit alpha [Arthrobacter stackebrandtii]MBP2411337.1 pyruvate dehydrogenase E1 component alpha subunit [Arthrobacter stackebrandtii]PYH00161.1 pyruvate dehydrogenase (acetyl-transferring) E1 component subunit alpha [Arthrobacter stackebrandtii]